MKRELANTHYNQTWNATNWFILEAQIVLGCYELHPYILHQLKIPLTISD